MSDTLVLAKMKGFGMLDALDLMTNQTFPEKLESGEGTATCGIIFTTGSAPAWGQRRLGWCDSNQLPVRFWIKPRRSKPGNGTPPLVGPIFINVGILTKGTETNWLYPTSAELDNCTIMAQGCKMSPRATSLAFLFSN